MTAHREKIKAWQSTIELTDKLVLDWGSGSKPVSRYIKYSNCTFVTIDNNTKIDKDRRSAVHIVHDIQESLTYSVQADVAFCIEVLEHVEQPLLVLDNIFDNLVSGGTLYITVPFQFEIHSDDDYWRFTENGIRLLLGWAGFTIKDIQAQEDNSGYFVEAIK